MTDLSDDETVDEGDELDNFLNSFVIIKNSASK